MFASPRTKLILHLSDLRIGNDSRLSERATAIISALTTNSERRDRFDFIVVTGDIKDRAANPVLAYEKAVSFLKDLGTSLLQENDQSRILVVPGNHDWCKDTGFLDYNRFVQRWYGDSRQAHCIKSDDQDEGAPIAYLLDHRDDDVVFLLLNSYWQHSRTKDRLVSGRVCQSQRQSFESQLALLFPNSSLCPPKLALMHQHLLQTREYPEYARKRIFSQDYSTTIQWLTERQTVITFHGPPSSYFLLRTDDIHSPQAELRMGTELMTLGAGACCPENGKQIAKNQFHAIAVNLKPRRFLESTIEKKAYHWDGENWISSRTKFTSHHTFSAFQKDLVEAEQFTCDQLHENMPHPLRSEQTDDWFWNHYSDVWTNYKLNGTDGGAPSLVRKEEFLTQLIAKLKEYNSSRSIFELLPFQLDAIYTFAAIFFGNEDIEAAAIREFKTKPWQSWLKFNDIVDYARWSHLDWANWIIADYLRSWIIESNPKRVGIVDLGYGLLRTIDAIGRNLPDSPSEQRYLGIDVSGDQLKAAKQMLAEARNSSRFFTNRKTNPFEHIREYFVEESGRRYWVRSNPHLSELGENGFNVFVCVYAMHHCSNSFRVQKSLRDGSFFRFIAHSAESGRRHLEDNLGSILDRVDDSMRKEFVEDLVMLSQERYSSGSQSSEIERAIDRVLELGFPDSQLAIYKMVFDTMQDGGLLCIADPNGMSRTFNRQEIFRSAAIAIAHFSDWVDAVSMVHRVGFRKIRVFRQIRLNSLQVRRVEVPADSIQAIVTEAGTSEAGQVARARSFHESIMKEEFEQFKSVFQPMAQVNVSALEILDQHMGYILVAEKPEAA